MEGPNVRKIVFGVSESAVPTLPAQGSDITWTTPWLTTLGGQPGDSDDAYLDEDSIDVTPIEESLTDDPPLAQNKLGEVMFKNGIEMVAFTTYSVKQAVFDLSSTSVATSNVTEEGVTITYRAMCIEYTGVGLLYFPKVRVKVSGVPSAIKDHSKVELEAVVFGTTTIPAGWQWHEFDGS